MGRKAKHKAFARFMNRLNNGRGGVAPVALDDAISDERFYRVGVSRISQEWLEAIERHDNIKLMRGDIEYRIPGTPFLVDGYDPSTRMIYEFYGDYWHGNPRVYKPHEYNMSVNRTFGYLYNRTITREQRLLSLGYSIVSVWEYDWIHRPR